MSLNDASHLAMFAADFDHSSNPSSKMDSTSADDDAAAAA
jgi:hypothetical protein